MRQELPNDLRLKTKLANIEKFLKMGVNKALCSIFRCKNEFFALVIGNHGKADVYISVFVQVLLIFFNFYQIFCMRI